MARSDEKPAAQMCLLLRAAMNLLDESLDDDPVSKIALKRSLAHSMVLALEWRSGANMVLDARRTP